MSESTKSTTTKQPPVEGKVVSSNQYQTYVDPAPYEPRPITKAEAGIFSVVAVAVLGGLGWLIKHDIDVQEQRAAEAKAEREERDRRAEEARKAREAWFNQQRAEGKIVVETRDGKYMAIPAEAYAQAEVKKKGEWI